MAKTVDLRKKSDLLARVTGQQPSQTQVAPPAQAVQTPGIQGQFPLGPGQVHREGASRYTAEEQRILGLLGISEDEKLPDNMAQILAEHGISPKQAGELRAHARNSRLQSDEYVPPIDPNTPPIEIPKDIPLESLPAEKQRDILKAVQQAKELQQQEQDIISQQQEVASLPPEIQQAILQANKTSEKTVPARPAQPAPTSQVRIGDNVSKPTVKAAKPDTVPLPKPEVREQSQDTPSTFTGDTLQFCPHCNYNLQNATDVPVTEEDKLAFLQTILGDLPFKKPYALYGGKVAVTFRVLSVPELDMLFSQVRYEVSTGAIRSAEALEERVQRYRMFLQLVSLSSENFRHDFPDGLTPETSPNATTFWQLPDDLPEGSKGLECIEQYMFSSIIKTESMLRILAITCLEFNRLAAKLEATGHDSDFWQATAPQL